MDIEAFHSRFFNVIARVVPGLEDLHYGIANGPPGNPLQMMRRLKEGSRRLLERVSHEASLAGRPEGSVGLDVGCGLGGTSRFLADRHAFRMHGLNINHEQLRLASDLPSQKRVSGRVTFTVGDAQRLPFGESRFDLAILIEVAFHVRAKERMLEELARVLKPGGRVLLVDQELSEPTDVMGLFFFVAFGAYRQMAERAGLRLVKEVDLTQEVAWWMVDYARSASLLFHLGAVLLALFRGGPRLALQYVAGVRSFNRLIREEFSRRGNHPAVRSFWFNGVRALREYTRAELESRRCTYKLFILEKPGR